jgi:hypothetical protein
MKLGLHPMNFSWAGGSAAIEPVLAGELEPLGRRADLRP